MVEELEYKFVQKLREEEIFKIFNWDFVDLEEVQEILKVSFDVYLSGLRHSNEDRLVVVQWHVKCDWDEWSCWAVKRDECV